jgi:hypothetical protein
MTRAQQPEVRAGDIELPAVRGTRWRASGTRTADGRTSHPDWHEHLGKAHHGMGDRPQGLAGRVDADVELRARRAVRAVWHAGIGVLPLPCRRAAEAIAAVPAVSICSNSLALIPCFTD